MSDSNQGGGTRDALFGVFNLFGSQVERLVLLNALFAIQFLPLLLAVALPLPIWIRLLLITYTSMASVLGVAVLYRMLAHIFEQDLVSPGLLFDLLQTTWRDAYTTWLPLVMFWTVYAFIALQQASGVLAILLQVGLWIGLVSANYWGPIFVRQPHLSSWGIMMESLRLSWRHPIETLLVTGTVLLVALIGAMSIAGLFLAIPVLVAMLQRSEGVV